MPAPDFSGRVEVPPVTSNVTVLPKWTIRNDEWVVVWVTLQRDGRGWKETKQCPQK